MDVPDHELDQIRSLARPLRDAEDLDPLLERIADARYVLLGEASHGTAEYYRWRAEITRRLIAEHGFTFVAVEGDWPDCWEVDRWVRTAEDGARDARDVLGAFTRWPTWMWANEEVAELVTWLRDHNTQRAESARAGFYGLDVYSLWESMRALMEYLEEHEPDAVASARAAYRCFEPYGEDPQEYAWATRMVPTSCEDEVVELLSRLRRDARRGADDPQSRFDAEQNAAVAAGAERYYRAMVGGGGESWNVRDTHMADTLDRLMAHHGSDARAVVWAHNTHVGDARATDMAAAGMVNLGQLVRERHADDGVVLVGFGGHQGWVIAGDQWGAPMRRMPVPAAKEGSHEDLLDRAAPGPRLLVFPEDRRSGWLASVRGHRAIGVVYRPEQEAVGNYVPTVMGRRYDAFLSFGPTEALHPLQPVGAVAGERETEPWGT